MNSDLIKLGLLLGAAWAAYKYSKSGFVQGIAVAGAGVVAVPVVQSIINRVTPA